MANTARLRQTAMYKRMNRIRTMFRVAVISGALISIAAALMLTARPYKRSMEKEDTQRRDIFLCLDLSSSNYALNKELTIGFRELVKGLDGDRIGISLFNTSSELYLPMTDDYEYADQRMEELENYLVAEEEFERNYAGRYEYVYEIPESDRARYDELNQIMASFDKGTTNGYASKGTSVIGEGLASCLFAFPELHDEKRTRMILLATDNIDQCIDDPLVTLADAADMCRKDAVTVFGIYQEHASEDEEAPDGLTPQEREEMFKAAAEATGGSLYKVTETFPAEEVLEAIQKAQPQVTKKSTDVRDIDQPYIWFWPMAAGFGIFFLCMTYLMIRGWIADRRRNGRKNLKRKIARAALLLIALLLVLGTGMRPIIYGEEMQRASGNLDVCFVVDTTISMWGEDYDGDRDRMAGVKRDMRYIMNRLPDSNFALMRFDNGSQVLTPLTRDVDMVEEAIGELDMPGVANAAGSSLNTAYNDMQSIMVSSSKKPERRTIVFFFSDGEITDGSKLRDFSELASMIDDGAVFGFGTEKGGLMRYTKSQYVLNPTTKEKAKTVINEDNLKQIADELGVSYVHCTGSEEASLQKVLARVHLISREAMIASGDAVDYHETYFFFAAILALIMMGWTALIFYRGGAL